jgi:S-adenosylmethionine:tRNA ribosyltransferase-isomerase
MKLEDFNYELPRECIAQYPSEQRGASRLLVLERETGTIAHRRFADIVTYFSAGDVLCINDTRVIPARLFGRKARTGGKVEVFLLEKINFSTWKVLVRSSGKVKGGEKILFDDTISCTVQEQNGDGKWSVVFQPPDVSPDEILSLGHMPLPPYIRRDDEKIDRDRYQTVYAQHSGSVAAPTAGLHFTTDMLSEIEQKRASVVKIFLHIGLGTFRPVKHERIEEHRMDREYYEIEEKQAKTINSARNAGRKLFVVGTSTTRALETMAGEEGVQAGKGWTDKFIFPPYRFRMVDHLITNFHLPRTTLLMLVSAFASREMILTAYEEAKEEGYRFFSYGDAMLIL